MNARKDIFPARIGQTQARRHDIRTRQGGGSFIFIYSTLGQRWLLERGASSMERKGEEKT